jgi:hypothetical protein
LLSLRTLVVLQLAAIAVLSAATVARFHVWAEVDERAHYANVQSLAEDGRYPRPEDLVSPDVQAITDDTFPRPSPNDPRNQGLAGRAYEAVQTPLYYLLATPAFLLPVDHRQKVFVLRAFDVVLLAVALALAAALARGVLGERWLAGFSALLAVVLWPGVLVRMVTVSNDVLAVPVGLLFALLAWQAWTLRSPARLVAAGGAFGLVVLTKVTLLYLAPVLVLAAADAILRWNVPRARLAAGAALLLPVVLVAPWVAVNEARYGRLGLTEGGAAVAALYAADPRLAGQDLLARLARLLDSSLPQEFASQYEDGGLGGIVTRAMTLALVAFGAAGALVARRAVGAIAAIVLGLPLVAGVVGLVVQDALGADDHFFGRYLYPAALLFALFGALAWTVAGRTRVVVGWTVGVSLVAAGFWVHLAAAYYFVDLGHRLGLA